MSFAALSTNRLTLSSEYDEYVWSNFVHLTALKIENIRISFQLFSDAFINSNRLLSNVTTSIRLKQFEDFGIRFYIFDLIFFSVLWFYQNSLFIILKFY